MKHVQHKPIDTERAVKLLTEGNTPQETAAALGCSTRQVRRAAQRWCKRNGYDPFDLFGRVV